MAENKTFTIHKSKKSLVDKLLTARKSLRQSLENTEHRLELVAEINGVEFINDARSADLLSTRDSMKCIVKPIVWIALTPPHERDYALIEKYVRYKIKGLVVCGSYTEDMRRKLEPLVEKFAVAADLEEAAIKSAEMATAEDAVLFSPSCQSTDQYQSSAERGNAFIKFVNQLEK